MLLFNFVNYVFLLLGILICYVYVPFYQNHHICYSCYWYFINSNLLKQIY